MIGVLNRFQTAREKGLRENGLFSGKQKSNDSFLTIEFKALFLKAICNLGLR